MSTTAANYETLAELMQQLGDIPLERIRMQPAPGTASEQDVLRLCEGTPKRLCELVDGVLVEKPMGHLESRLAFWLNVFLGKYLETNDIGIATTADGPHRLAAGVVRFPDVAFISYDRIPEDATPTTAMPTWVPNLAVEIISPGNTKREMERKCREYFDAGTELVWIVDPRAWTVEVFTAVSDSRLLDASQSLEGGTVLPGFRVSIRDWFERASKLKK